jgi:DNA primase
MSDALVERVREATDIVEIISATVELKRAGANLKGLCPFHQEKTPSFVVSPERQVYHCFGCGVGGDVFSFVMSTEGMTFPEVLKHLAQRAGIPLPERADRTEGDRLQEIVDEAQKLFQRTLSGSAGRGARDYLKRRGLSPEVLDGYGIGLAPDAWRTLTDSLRSRYRLEELIQAGVVVRSPKGGQPYDRFRNRVTFPIARPGGRIAGFGARTLGEEEPKYLNSPDGPLYKKGELLFGVPQARESLRRHGLGVLVEGYFDVVGLAQVGIRNVVAPCGTALTAGQVRVLQRHAKRWILFYDGDTAGLKATWRSLEVLLAQGVKVVVASTPEGSDPDEMARGGGLEEVRSVLRGALEPIPWLAQLASGEHQRAWLLERVAILIGWAADPLVRQVWVEEAASRLRVREDLLWDAVRARSATAGGGRAPAVERTEKGKPRLSALERDLIVLVVEQPEVLEDVVDRVKAAPSVGPVVREILGWVDGLGRPPVAADIVRRLEARGVGGATAYLLKPPPGCASEGFRSDILRRLRQDVLQEELRMVNKRLKDLEAQEEDTESLEGLLSAKQRLVRELDSLVRQ